MENLTSEQLFALGNQARAREELARIEKHDGLYSFKMLRGPTDFRLSDIVENAVSAAIRTHWPEIHAGAKHHLEAAFKRGVK